MLCETRSSEENPNEAATFSDSRVLPPISLIKKVSSCPADLCLLNESTSSDDGEGDSWSRGFPSPPLGPINENKPTPPMGPLDDKDWVPPSFTLERTRRRQGRQQDVAHANGSESYAGKSSSESSGYRDMSSHKLPCLGNPAMGKKATSCHADLCRMGEPMSTNEDGEENLSSEKPEKSHSVDSYNYLSRELNDRRSRQREVCAAVMKLPDASVYDDVDTTEDKAISPSSRHHNHNSPPQQPSAPPPSGKRNWHHRTHSRSSEG